MKKLGIIGACALVSVFVAGLAIIPAGAQGNQNQCYPNYYYDGSTVPEKYPGGAWEKFKLDPKLKDVEWYSDREGMFHIDADDVPPPGYDVSGVGFVREELSLADGDKITMEARMKVERAGTGTWLFDFVLGLLDGDKAVPVLGKLDTSVSPAEIDITIILAGWLNFAFGTATPESQPATYRLEVDKSGNTVELFCNNVKVDFVGWLGFPIEVQYDELVSSADLAELIADLGGGDLVVPEMSMAIAGYSSHTIWDYVMVEVCWPTTPGPSDMTDSMVACFGYSVDQGTLEGVSPWPGWADLQLAALGRLIAKADSFVDKGLNGQACSLLAYLDLIIDPDGGAWVQGDAVPELLDMIQTARTGLGCIPPP